MTLALAQVSVFTQAFGLGLGLIVAIGAQNAFVLRQGLRGEHVILVVLFCAVVDALLIAGAACASVSWFVLLGFGARWLAPWFAKPRAWHILDVVIGLVMLALAVMLVGHTFF